MNLLTVDKFLSYPGKLANWVVIECEADCVGLVILRQSSVTTLLVIVSEIHCTYLGGLFDEITLA
jgi:hypothetical protein